MTETHRPPRFSERLDTEWQSIATSRRTVRTIRSWANEPSCVDRQLFADATDANEIIDATHREAGDAATGLLTFLVELAQHDELAGRIVLQRLLPGIISAAAKYRYMVDGDDPAEEAISAAWIAIRRYDLTRRSAHIAPALISDTIYLAFRRRARQHVPQVSAVAPHLLSERFETPPPTALVELADVVRTARHVGVATHDLDLIRALVQADSPSLVARQMCVTPRTIRNRRDRTIEQLRDVVAVAA